MHRHKVHRFGEFVLDESRCALFRGNTEIALRKQALDMLLLLVRHQGELLDKDLLMREIWGGTVVTENSITQCLKDIRQAIGDEDLTLIRTVPRRGYIFQMPVSTEDANDQNAEPATHSASKLKTRVITTVLAFALLAWFAHETFFPRQAVESNSERLAVNDSTQALPTETPSVAVLPFTDMSPDPGQEYFSDGLTEELISLLAQVRGLSVISRTSAFSFKNRAMQIPTIAAQLGAEYIVEGSVRMSGDSVRITAQLIDGETDLHVWSQTYERPLEEIFAIQEEIATSVVAELQVKVLGNFLSQRPIAPEAYTLYLRARHFQRVGAEPDLLKALEAYQQVLAIEPGYAPAWVGISYIHTLRARAGTIPIDEGARQARTAIDKALSLDPELASAWASLAYLERTFSWDWDAADAAIDKALNLAPGNAEVLGTAASLASTLGRNQESIRLFEKAAALDPLDLASLRALGRRYLKARELDKAKATFGRILELNSEHTRAHLDLGLAYVMSGDPERGLLEMDRSVPGPTKDHYRTIALWALGRESEAQELLNQLVKTNDPANTFALACVFAWQGNNDQAIQWLQSAYDQRSPNLVFILGMSCFENIYDDPRFPEFLEKLRLLKAWKDAQRASEP